MQLPPCYIFPLENLQRHVYSCFARAMLHESGSQGTHADLQARGQIWGKNRRRKGTAGMEIGCENKKNGRGTYIERSDAKICVYDNTVLKSG